jgi:purine-binding chemotaxis protein CheW
VTDHSSSHFDNEPALRDAEILRQRALELANNSVVDETGATSDVLLCRVRDERYAVDLRSLRSVHRSGQLTAVPCTVPQIAGILNVRGELITVVDLRVALNLDSQAASGASSQVLLSEFRGAPIGLLVDEVLGVDRLALDRLDESISGASYTRGVAVGSIAVLDLEHLLAQQGFDKP